MRENYDYNFADDKMLTRNEMHDISMVYLQKVAYDGITPEQLATEYMLAQDRISEFMQVGSETPETVEGAKTDGQAHGFKLEDTIQG